MNDTVALEKVILLNPPEFAKGLPSVQPMTAPTGIIFNLHRTHDHTLPNNPAPDAWFDGSSDHRTLMHPFKYGDRYLNSDTYFYKIKLKGL